MCVLFVSYTSLLLPCGFTGKTTCLKKKRRDYSSQKRALHWALRNSWYFYLE